MAEGRHSHYSSNRDPHRSGSGDRSQRRDAPNAPDIDLTGIQFGERLDPQLFNEIAKRCAETIGTSNKKLNKPSQLRRFYDELVMWCTKVEQSTDPDKTFEESRPFILMLNAKAAYANGRDLVDGNFVRFLEHCLRQAKTAKTLPHVKLFFEAFLGFYKERRPSDN